MAIFWTPKVIIGALILCLFVSLINYGIIFTDELMFLIIGVYLIYKIMEKER